MRVWLMATVAAFLPVGSATAQQIGPMLPASQLAPLPPRTSSPATPIQTLQQALQRTYQTSPTLMRQRAELRRLDSGVALVRAESHPRIVTELGVDQELYTSRLLGNRGRNLRVTAGVDQILFAGGRIRNLVRAADVRVVAGRWDLRAIEAEVFTESVAAYASVLRDREISALTADQVRVLEANLGATRERFRVGDLTRADVAQSEARLSTARSALATAQGRLQFTEEEFERLTGARAGSLAPMPALPPLPATADAAERTALAENADLAAFTARARAAGYAVAAAKAERLPTISAVGTTSYTNALGTADRALGLPPGTLPNSATDVGAGFALRLPLYQGGAVAARVRDAEEIRAQLVEQAIAAERLTVASARSAFASWQTALVAIRENEAAIAANQVALDSVKVEQTVGARDIIDVLNAEQELLGNRIALAATRRDAYVAAYTLLNTIGGAEAVDLADIVGPINDPTANYRLYAKGWSDWSDGPRAVPASSRTVPGQADSPVTRLLTDQPLSAEKKP